MNGALRRTVGWAIAGVAGATACAPFLPLEAPPPLERPAVERLDPRTVQVRWPATFSSGPVTVRAGTSPEASLDGPVLGTGLSELTLRATTRDGPVSDRRRLYYALAPAGGGPVAVVAERKLPLQGADNFRDLGGYETADGRHVRWGRVYRSNALADLTRSDLTYLARERVRLVCDFRTATERRRSPDPSLPPVPAVALALPVDQKGVDPAQMQERIRRGEISAAGIRQTLLQAYRNFPTEDTAQWAALFARLSEPDNLPTVIHCTAGKDRTGFAAALILLTLGVPEQTVFEDYLMTNTYRRDYDNFVLRWVPLYSLFRTQPEDLLPLLEARREYLEASLAAIREHYGSVDAYVTGPLGVTPERRAALEHNLLR